jgi:16S rRNA (adenine1518-N6/adenine1519-N6)-dimethyltransferase
VAPKSKLGQNFLRDAAAIGRIAASLGPLDGRTVVEIGPGRGAITRALAAAARRVVAAEVDHALALALKVEMPAVEVVEQDVLGFDFAAEAARAGEKLLVAGNLPYYITSPILLKLAGSHGVLERAVLMVQREVAERVTAAPGSRAYGLLSATVQMHGPAQELFTLPPEAFSPPPEVHSTVFRWRFAPRFAELGVEEAGFLGFARQAFAQKRKTLANNLRAAGFAAARVERTLEAAGVEARARAEGLGVEQLAAVWRQLRGNY